jgi:uncharacterized membrane protein YciS (DUF1049 family)
MTETGNFEHRLDSLELQGVEQKNRLIHVERSLGEVARNVTELGSKLDTVVTAVTTVTAQPKFDIYKVMPLIVSLVVLIGAASTAITYISSNINAAELARQAERLSFVKERLDNGWFKPVMQIRAPGGAVVPTP